MNSIENQNLIKTCTKNIKNILNLSIKYNKETENVLVIYDTQNGLTNILTESYKKSLTEICGGDFEIFEKKVEFLDFDKSNKEEILREIEKLKERDLVVMIQTTNFRLDDFRIRLHLFTKKLKVIEHMHLDRNDENVWDVYVNSLEYDKDYYYNHAHNIKNKLANSEKLIIKSGENFLEINGELEEAKLNIGDYSQMENIGGTFPIGEVFTESKLLENMSGKVLIYALADTDFNMQMYEPFDITIEKGVVVGYDDNAPLEFVNIFNQVKDYERSLIREIGFGLNKAITKERFLGDITAFERIYGMHLSMGEKHSVYKKEGLISKKTKYHVDLFPVVDKVTTINKNTKLEEVIFENEKYVLD